MPSTLHLVLGTCREGEIWYSVLPWASLCLLPGTVSTFFLWGLVLMEPRNIILRLFLPIKCKLQKTWPSKSTRNSIIASCGIWRPQNAPEIVQFLPRPTDKHIQAGWWSRGEGSRLLISRPYLYSPHKIGTLSKIVMLQIMPLFKTLQPSGVSLCADS